MCALGRVFGSSLVFLLNVFWGVVYRLDGLLVWLLVCDVFILHVWRVIVCSCARLFVRLFRCRLVCSSDGL